MTANISASASHQAVGHSINKSSYEKVNSRFKTGAFTTPTATTSADTVAINIEENFGITRLLGIRGFQHTTENSVIECEEDDATSVTAMSNGTMTITINGTSSPSKRFYLVYGL